MENREYDERTLESVRGELAHLKDEVKAKAVEEFKRGRTLQYLKAKYDPDFGITK